MLTGISCLIWAVFWVRLRRTKLVYITDFQVGIRFYGSDSCKILPPGGYRSSAQHNPITVVDMRPYPFVLERLMLQDVLHSNTVISIGGEIVVRDPRLAVTTLKNLVDDTLLVIRENLRVTISHLIIATSSEERDNLTASIADELDRELQSRGVRVQNIEITELWAWQMRHAIPAGTN
jgi:hypothetical protein